jgi:AI-2 transport protein TqsA
MLWGIAGAFIGVPILIALATVCARHAAGRPIAMLLSAAGPRHVKIDE